jgi:hypothetical protein
VACFADLPLPVGRAILVEINLIGWALVGGTAEGLNALLAYDDAAALAGLPLRGALAHVIYERGGATVGEAWHEGRLDRTGRNEADLSRAERASACQIRVDLRRQPASDRLRKILAELVPEADPAQLPTVHNALAVADRTMSLSAPDPELLAAQRLIVAHVLTIPTGGAGPVLPLVNASQAIYDHMKRGRRMWSMDARGAAALLLAAHIPAACARARGSDPATMAREYRRLLALAADRLYAGRWEMLGELIVRVVRDGYLAPLDALGSHLSAEAIALRDAALDGLPDPLDFAGKLYDAAPFAFAAGWLSRWVVEHAALPAAHTADWARRAADAEDLFVRICDGLHSQLLDWILGCIWVARADVSAAHARGDRDRVWMLLREGEIALRWPRSYRPFLLGEGPEPTVRLAPSGQRSEG